MRRGWAEFLGITYDTENPFESWNDKEDFPMEEGKEKSRVGRHKETLSPRSTYSLFMGGPPETEIGRQEVDEFEIFFKQV